MVIVLPNLRSKANGVVVAQAAVHGNHQHIAAENIHGLAQAFVAELDVPVIVVGNAWESVLPKTGGHRQAADCVEHIARP